MKRNSFFACCVFSRQMAKTLKKIDSQRRFFRLTNTFSPI